MKRRPLIASFLLLAVVLATAAALAAWKADAMEDSAAASASPYEPMESVVAVQAEPWEARATTSAIGTVLATRSVTLRNELPGTVERVALTPGEIVESGRVLVQLDVDVERAELAALEAQATLAETLLERSRQAIQDRAVSEIEVDRARAERDVARAQITRIEAVIERKTIRAPFRSRVGLSDVHPGQFLDTGTELTTLQGVGESSHVDFSVAQSVAAQLGAGGDVRVFVDGSEEPLAGEIVAVDSRIDEATRTAKVRARVTGEGRSLAPGSSARVEVPVGSALRAVSVPASAVRRGPEGDHVFVVEEDDASQPRARRRPVRLGGAEGDRIVVVEGLEPGERVAAAGSFKLREGVLLALSPGGETTSTPGR